MAIEIEMTQGFGYGLEPVFANDLRQHNVVAHRTVARSIVGSGQTGFFTKCTVADMMVHLYGPMTSIPQQKLFSIRLMCWYRCNAVNGLGTRAAGLFYHFAVAVSAKHLTPP